MSTITKRSASTLRTDDEILIFGVRVAVREVTRNVSSQQFAIVVRDVHGTGERIEILAPAHRTFDVVEPDYLPGTVVDFNGTPLFRTEKGKWMRPDTEVAAISDENVTKRLSNGTIKMVFDPRKPVEIKVPGGVNVRTIFPRGTAVRWNESTMLRTSIVDNWVYDHRGAASSARDRDVAEAIKDGYARIIFEPLTQSNGQWLA